MIGLLTNVSFHRRGDTIFIAADSPHSSKLDASLSVSISLLFNDESVEHNVEQNREESANNCCVSSLSIDSNVVDSNHICLPLWMQTFFGTFIIILLFIFSHSIEHRPFVRIDNCVGIESDSDNDGCCWRIVNSRSCPANDASKRLTLIQLSGQFECRVNDDKTMENFVLSAMRRQLRKPNNMVGWFALCCTSLIFMYNVCVFFFFLCLLLSLSL
jgi:hypothetical protein